VALELIVWAAAGAFGGLLLVALFDPHGQITDLDSILAIAGAVTAVGLQRLFRS
jgi:hypothetical protein